MRLPSYITPPPAARYAAITAPSLAAHLLDLHDLVHRDAEGLAEQEGAHRRLGHAVEDESEDDDDGESDLRDVQRLEDLLARGPRHILQAQLVELGREPALLLALLVCLVLVRRVRHA